MQKLKREIREQIIKSAIAEFEEKGYEKASMRSIAASAGITAGNLYRYYTNKDALFSAVVGPVYDRIAELITTYNPEELTHPAGCSISLELEIAELIARVYAQHKSVLLILLDGSVGSEYERAKEDMIKLLEERIRDTLLPQIKAGSADLTDPLFPHAMAVGYYEGLIAILRGCGDLTRIKNLTRQYTRLYFKNIINRFD